MNIQLKNMNQEEVKELLPEGLILLGYRGSIAHGMWLPPSDEHSTDDKDLMGVFINPRDYYLGLRKVPDGKERFIKEWDVVSYEVKKMLTLLAKCNPNVMSLLWLPEKHYLYIHKVGQYLIDNRDVFTAKLAYHSFSGYAFGQLHRMEHHSYEGWMGAKRKALVDKYGYCPRNASHLIRLLRMGIEFLTEGQLIVERPDAQQLLEIKRGEWSLEKIKKEAEILFEQARLAYIHSRLPNKPDDNAVNELCVKILETYFQGVQ